MYCVDFAENVCLGDVASFAYHEIYLCGSLVHDIASFAYWCASL